MKGIVPPDPETDAPVEEAANEPDLEEELLNSALGAIFGSRDDAPPAEDDKPQDTPN